MNIQKFQKYSREISPLYPALADKAEAISRAIENSPINVTAISDGDGILVKHIIDSLCCAEAVARYADAARGEGADGNSSGAERRLTLCDVGSGGGFPALPIAAALGDISVCALDSTAKKCRFIEESAASAGITNLTSVCARAEEAKGLFGTFDFVTARAVARLNMLCEFCIPLLRVGGEFLPMKGKSGAEELTEAENAIAVLRAKTVEYVEYAIRDPAFDEDRQERFIARIRKTDETEKIYPRSFAQIKKKPL